MHVCFVGLSPSSMYGMRVKAGKMSPSLKRLLGWCDKVGLQHWGFINVLEKPGSTDIWESSGEFAKYLGGMRVVALGGLASRACTKYGVPHLALDHPSPRNRNFNDSGYEIRVIRKLKSYIK